MTDTLTPAQRLDADRKASMDAYDERALARMARGETCEHAAPSRNAMLTRDMVAINRSAAAMRRFARTPMGRRTARAA